MEKINALILLLTFEISFVNSDLNTIPERDLQHFFKIGKIIGENPVVKTIYNSVESVFIPGKVIPTVVPNQEGVVPLFQRDFACNTELFHDGCSTLAEWGLSVTGPIQKRIENTLPLRVIKYIDDKSLEIHDQVVEKVLPKERQDLIQNISQIPRIERIVNHTIDVLLKVPKYDYKTNLGSPLKTYNITPELNLLNETNKMKGWLYCNFYQSLSSECTSNKYEDAINDAGKNEFGFQGKSILKLEYKRVELILVTGIISSCKDYREGCRYDEQPLQTDIYEGYYRFDGVDVDTNFPVYIKSTEFHPEVKQIVLFYEKYKGPLTDFITPDGLAAAFVVNAKSFTEHMYKKRFPFIYYNTLNLPAICSANSFPYCLNGNPNWRLNVVTATTICSGYRNAKSCTWDINLEIKSLNKKEIRELLKSF